MTTDAIVHAEHPARERPCVRERVAETHPALSTAVAILARMAMRAGDNMVRRVRARAAPRPGARRDAVADAEPMAVRVAAMLRRKMGGRAPAAAADRSAGALARGDLAGADLYHAVSVILRDRDGVFSRMPRDRIE